MDNLRPSVADKRQTFRKLHEAGCFVIPNPWNVGSARYLQGLGFKALATTSSGHAHAQGHPDGAQNRNDVLAHFRELVEATDIPVNGDFENGFADDPSGVAENVAKAKVTNAEVIRPYNKPLRAKAGFKVLRGNLFDSAIMKTSGISEEFQQRYLNDPKDPNAFEGRAVVFDGPEDYHHRIDDPKLAIDERTILFMRGAGPIGHPGAAEVVNMQPPAALIKRGITSLPCIGDGRQSGTSASPSILNASPEAAAGGGLGLLKNGDKVRIDLRKGEANILISEKELEARKKALADKGGFPFPAHQTPWQEIQRGIVDQLNNGMVLKPAVKYQRIAQTKGLPRDNH